MEALYSSGLLKLFQPKKFNPPASQHNNANVSDCVCYVSFASDAIREKTTLINQSEVYEYISGQ